MVVSVATPHRSGFHPAANATMPNGGNKRAKCFRTIVLKLIHFTDFRQLVVATIADIVSEARIRGN
jgi:hypothetical protein